MTERKEVAPGWPEANKIEFWMYMHRQAGEMLRHCHEIRDYYSRDNHAYIVAWQERQAFCYRQIERWRGRPLTADGNDG